MNKLLITLSATLSVAQAEPVLIPQPQAYKELTGTSEITPETVIVFDGKVSGEAKLLAEQLRKATGYKLPLIAEEKLKDHKAFIRLDLEEKKDAKKSTYTLNSKDNKITIKGSQPAGVFYGTQTLLQLLPSESSASTKQEGVKWSFDNCSISDEARFVWRGMHLDESRHFFGKEFVKRYIDLIASHKMNVFHWHLIDDGGWRLEIKKYPKLTEAGGFRKGTAKGWKVNQLEIAKDKKDLEQGEWYGGYYTQEDVKEIVAYATARHVCVIPEIEMPGHTLPATTTYPFLKCGGDLVSDSQGWTPSTQNSYCAGKEESFEFIENVLDEVMTLFPDEYIHIGGDECIKEFWAQCPHCEKRMKDENIKNVDELQSYFIQRVEKYLNSKGKKLIGWDEITHGGLTPNATVMFWIGMGAVPKTVGKGHEVIMTPMNPCYFDYSYNSNSTEKVYKWEIVPQQFIGTEKEKLFLGSQGNVWTEWMETGERVEEMVLPRMLSLSETLWTKAEKKDLNNFLGRLDNYYGRLDVQGLNYYMPSPRPVKAAIVFDDKAKVEFHAPPKGFEIRYSLGSAPVTKDSKIYAGPLFYDNTTTVNAALVKGDKVSPPVSVDAIKFTQQDLPDLEPGLDAQYAEGKWKKVPTFHKLFNAVRTKVDSIDISGRKKNDHFAFLFNGFIKIDKPGNYKFTLSSDDGSYFKIAGAKVVDHDGPHGPSKKSGEIILKSGVYPVEIGYLEIGGGQVIEAWIQGPDSAEEKMTAKHFFRAK